MLGEGIETTLSAAARIVHQNTLLAGAWAAGFAQTCAYSRCCAGIEVLTLLVDHDSNGSGQEAAQKCAERWSAAGREVEFLTPARPDTDFNDVNQAALLKSLKIITAVIPRGALSRAQTEPRGARSAVS